MRIPDLLLGGSLALGVIAIVLAYVAFAGLCRAVIAIEDRINRL